MKCNVEFFVVCEYNVMLNFLLREVFYSLVVILQKKAIFFSPFSVSL